MNLTSRVNLCAESKSKAAVLLRIEEIIWVKTNQLQRIIRTGRTGHWTLGKDGAQFI